jgi:hypothetical protein
VEPAEPEFAERVVVLTRLTDTASAPVIESEQPGGGVRRAERA